MVSPGMFTDHLTAENTVFVPHDSAEGYLFDFAVNLQTLNYLQTLHLLQTDQLNNALEYMQTGQSAFSQWFFTNDKLHGRCYQVVYLASDPSICVFL